MNKHQQQPPVQNIADDEIDLRELFKVIWQGKWIIIVTTFVFAVTSVIYVLSLPDIYKSEALLAPVTEDSSLKVPGQLGGLAALAGVNLGAMGGDDKTGLALEILKSREFLGRFIEKYDLLIPVMAVKGWSRDSNSLEIDGDIYNNETKQWVRKVKSPFVSKPSVQETYKEFTKLLQVSQNTTTGMITLSVEYYSPYIAKEWADNLIKEINEDMRQRELQEADSSIAYLNNQIAQTNLADVRTMLFSLIEEQTKTLMLANVRDEYVLKTIDPAIVSEMKNKPQRPFIVILTVLVGGFLSIFMILFMNFIRK